MTAIDSIRITLANDIDMTVGEINPGEYNLVYKIGIEWIEVAGESARRFKAADLEQAAGKAAVITSSLQAEIASAAQAHHAACAPRGEGEFDYAAALGDLMRKDA